MCTLLDINQGCTIKYYAIQLHNSIEQISYIILALFLGALHRKGWLLI